MSRPSLPVKMVRCAITALLAAIEIYNKPRLDYREQTFALLTVNAWEIFLKARIIQQSGGKIQAIYRRQENSIRYVKNEEGEPLTITLTRALDLTNPPIEVRRNIKGLSLVRNQIAHLGLVSVDLQLAIQQFGTASIKNFVELAQEWFTYPLEIPYFVPVGFVGDVEMIKSSSTGRQKILLNALHDLAKLHSDDKFSVALRVKVNLDPNLKGGGTIGFTKDPNAMRVQITDDKALETFPVRYNSLVQKCRNRYPDFKQNDRFNKVMKLVKANANCCHIRKLDPDNPKSGSKPYYNWEAAVVILDKEYLG